MTLKYILVDFHKRHNLLYPEVICDGVSDIKNLEKLRTSLLKTYPQLNPQNLQVIQYDDAT